MGLDRLDHPHADTLARPTRRRVEVLPRWELVRRQWPYWATAYRRTWKASLFSSFVVPLFYVLVCSLFKDKRSKDAIREEAVQ